MAGLTKPDWPRLGLAGSGPTWAGFGPGWVLILSLDRYGTTTPPFHGHPYLEDHTPKVPNFTHPVTLCAALVTAINALQIRKAFLLGSICDFNHQMLKTDHFLLKKTAQIVGDRRTVCL